MPRNRSHCCLLVLAPLTSFHVFLTSCSSSVLSTLPQSPDFSNADLTRLHLKILGLIFSSHYMYLCISWPVFVLRAYSSLCLECLPITKERKKERKTTARNDSQKSHFETASERSLDVSSVVSDVNPLPPAQDSLPCPHHTEHRLWCAGVPSAVLTCPSLLLDWELFEVRSCLLRLTFLV